MKLKCQCCGFEQEFTDENMAYNLGWDAPPRFSYVACNLCPGVCIVLGAGHKLAHAIWDKEGRPSEFSLEKCATDDKIAQPDKLKDVQDGMDKLAELIDDDKLIAVKALLARMVKR